jgi:non-specific serine/threonine protein kinase
VPNIKSNNPFFELPNGQFFLIPEEWFSQYKIFIEMGKIDANKIIIRKSQLPLLEKLQNYDATKLSDTKNIDFVLSKNLKATLRNYQKEGVNWLINHYNNKLGACLADDMGLGKTLR